MNTLYRDILKCLAGQNVLFFTEMFEDFHLVVHIIVVLSACMAWIKYSLCEHSPHTDAQPLVSDIAVHL